MGNPAATPGRRYVADCRLKKCTLCMDIPIMTIFQRFSSHLPDREFPAHLPDTRFSVENSYCRDIPMTGISLSYGDPYNRDIPMTRYPYNKDIPIVRISLLYAYPLTLGVSLD